MKFIPVALGLLALASCSNDDFLGDSPAKVDIRANMGEGDMVVTVAETPLAGSATTRALRDFNYPTDENPNPADPLYFFENGDQIRVYDQWVMGFDLYQYNPKHAGSNEFAFERIHNKTNIGEPTLALYPRENIIRGFWEMKEGGHDQNPSNPDYHTSGWVKVDIACHMTYWADYTTTSPDPEAETVPLYQERVPLFGAVKAQDKGYLEANLEYLTGILCWEGTGVPEYAKYLRVRLYDPIKEEYLPIAGRFKTELIKDGTPLIAYTKDANGNDIVDEAKTARITYQDLLTEADYYGQDNDEDVDPCDQIIVDLDTEVGLTGGDEKHVKVFVPLVCTDKDGREVKIIVETSMDGENWDESWISPITKIERGMQYYAKKEYNVALKGHTICAINDALAIEVEKANEGETVTINCENPIEINADCFKLLIPNKKVDIKINMLNGVYANSRNQTLIMQYVNPEDTKNVPASVELIGKSYWPETGWSSGYRRFNLDTQLPGGIFTLVTVPSGGDGMHPDPSPVKFAQIDATAFIFGDKTVGMSYMNANGTDEEGYGLVFSDNVKKIIVDENAAIIYTQSEGAYTSLDDDFGGLVIPNTKQPAGYQNAGIDSIAINGVFIGGIDAHATAAPNVNLTVKGGDKFAVLAGGDYRVKGKIDLPEKGFIWAFVGDPTGSRPDGEPVIGGRKYEGVAAAYEDVTVSGQSFISGAVFSKNKNITINNVNFNMNDLLKNGGELSDLIYDLFTDDQAAQIVQFLSNYGYGPLYAENGSVDVTADNSTLIINNRVNNEVAGLLNPHAAWAVQFTVYAKKDIDLKTKNEGSINTYTNCNMWAENDVNLKGTITSRGGIVADHDYAMEGKSRANFVQAGRNATVSVDPQDGLCEAIETLVFYKNTDTTNPGNALNLNEGYITQLINAEVDWSTGSPVLSDPIMVNLVHGQAAAYTAIAKVSNPDFLVADNTKGDNWSKWNGQQIPASLMRKYVPYNEDNLWTASMLAAQVPEVSTNNAILRSDIDLDNKNWAGITTLKDWPYTFAGNNHTVKNLVIVSPDNQTAGFINRANNTVAVSNLTLDNVTSKIARTSNGAVSYGTGAVIGRADKAATLERVKVKLGAGKFGSDGAYNLKSANIGGAMGAAMAGATLSGVQVDAKDATLAGYYGIGGLIGKSKGNVVIDKNCPNAEIDLMAPEVKDLKIEVTYVETSTASDLNQGKTGLYIGTAEFITSEGTPAVVYKNAEEYKADHPELEHFGPAEFNALSDEQKIKTPAVPATTSTIKINNAQDATTAYTINEKIGNVVLLDKVFYHKGDETFKYKNVKPDTNKTPTQTMIGFLGKEVVNPEAIIINGKKYYVKIQGGNTYDLYNALYFMWATDWE